MNRIMTASMTSEEITEFFMSKLPEIDRSMDSFYPSKVMNPRQRKRLLKKVTPKWYKFQGQFEIHVGGRECCLYRHLDDQGHFAVYQTMHDPTSHDRGIFSYTKHAIDRYYEREQIEFEGDRIRDFALNRYSRAFKTPKGWATPEGGLFLGNNIHMKTYISSRELKGDQIEVVKMLQDQNAWG